MLSAVVFTTTFSQRRREVRLQLSRIGCSAGRLKDLLFGECENSPTPLRSISIQELDTKRRPGKSRFWRAGLIYCTGEPTARRNKQSQSSSIHSVSPLGGTLYSFSCSCTRDSHQPNSESNRHRKTSRPYHSFFFKKIFLQVGDHYFT